MSRTETGQHVKKAIIPVAGWGTRRLPITKTIEKCMLPVGNRPLIDYVVQDCLTAGITEFIFVVSNGSTQVESYYRDNAMLNNYLQHSGRDDMLPLVASPRGVKMHFIAQPSHGKYGTAVPVALAAHLVDYGESVVVLMGDDFFYNTDGSSEIERMIVGTPVGWNGILGAVLREDDNVTGRYGSIIVSGGDNLIRVEEHPAILPHPFIKNVSKYLLTYNMIQAVRRYVETDHEEGEYYIFTPFERLLREKSERMKLVRAQGEYLDGGSLDGWLYANNVVCGAVVK